MIAYGAKVSICINNYNYSDYVLFAIKSALTQTYPNIEVIVVDDGSTDTSLDVLRGLSDRVTVIEKENGGQASAINAGFFKCCGDLILFLDADDGLMPNAVECIVSAWDQEWAKCQFPLQIIDKDGNPTGHLYPSVQLEAGNLLSSMMMYGSYRSAPTSGNVFSRDFLEKVMPIPDEEWMGYADCYLLFSAPFYGQVGLVTAPLGYYRQHGQNMTAIFTAGKLNEKVVQADILRDIKQNGLVRKSFIRRDIHDYADAALNQPYHLLERFISLIISPSSHPIRDDNLNAVHRSLCRAILYSKNTRVFKKLVLLVWSQTVLLAPCSLRRVLLNLAFQYKAAI